MCIKISLLLSKQTARISLRLMVGLLLLINFNCKEEIVEDLPKAPKISYLDPPQATVGTSVKIVGENFGILNSENEVTINNKIVEIISANASEILVKIPLDVGTGEVTVTTNGIKTRGPEFIYYNELVINSIEPLSGPFNTEILIEGENFETDPTLMKVQINEKDVPIQSSSPTEIKVLVPKGTGSGKITISSAYSMAEGQKFEYVLVPVVITIAGNGFAGFANGIGESAQFNNPDGLAIDQNDNIYICDRNNHQIRKIDTEGNVSTLAGSGTQGIVDGDLQSASFDLPSGITTTTSSDFFITDSGSGNIRKISASGQVTTIAGDGIPGFTDGVGSTARFGSPRGITIDQNNNLWVADFGNSAIRKVSQAGVVTTVAGDGTHGFADGSGIVARFNFPSALLLENESNLLVVDNLNNRIRRLSLSGDVTTFAGSSGGYVDGELSSAKFLGPLAIAYEMEGDLIMADSKNYRVRRINQMKEVSTIAGNGINGFKNGIGEGVQFGLINSLVVNSKGEIIISDGSNHVIRKIKYE